MNITDKKKRRLFQDLQDKYYRSEYVSSSVDVGVASQIKALREQRNWNQTKLAEEANMHQVRISALENPSHSPTLKTLKKLATAFDVALMVRFVPFSDLAKWKLSLSPNSLEVPSFNEEDYFKENDVTELNSSFIEDYYSQTGKRQGIESAKYPLAEPINVVDIGSWKQSKGKDSGITLSIRGKTRGDTANETAIS